MRLPLIVFTCVFGLLGGLTHTSAKAEGKKMEPQVVGKITDVKVLIQTSDPPNLLVEASAQVSTGGYTNTRLVRAVYEKAPEDGIQDYFLLTTPPSGIATQAISTVKGKDTWNAYPNWVKGVRVHGLGNGTVVKMLEGK